MKVWEIYALIGGDNRVKNVALYETGEGGYTLANVQAIELYGNGSYAVDVTQIPVGIDDIYVNGVFYRNGIVINSVPTDTDRVDVLEYEHAAMNTALDDLAVAILEG